MSSLALLPAFLACSDPTSVRWDLDELEVTTSLSSTDVREQVPITVTVTVTNVGRVQRSISAYCFDVFLVTTADGTRVGPGEVACAAAASSSQWRAIAPGEQVSYQSSWNGYRYRPDPTESRLLPPGTYLLRGAAWPLPKVTGSPGSVPMQPVLSDPIEVAVLPPY